jgi:hypothetical protein
MTYITAKNLFLYADQTFKNDLHQALPIIVRYIGDIGFRMQVSLDEYLACNVDGELYITFKNNDENIWRGNGYIVSIYNHYLTINHNNILVTEPIYFKLMNTSIITFYNSESTDCEKLYMSGMFHFSIGKEYTKKLEILRNIVHKSEHTRITNLFSLHPYFAEILDNPRLKNMMNQIYGNHFHLTTYSSNTLRKGKNNGNWHVDYPYHNMNEPYPVETMGIQVLISLDDFTEENGATYYIPQSHIFRSFPKGESIDCNIIRRITVPKYSIIIMLAKTWHTEGVNNTNSSRSALLANFSPSYVPIKDKHMLEEIDKNKYFEVVGEKIQYIK